MNQTFHALYARMANSRGVEQKVSAQQLFASYVASKAPPFLLHLLLQPHQAAPDPAHNYTDYYGDIAVAVAVAGHKIYSNSQIQT
jgi:hypothetical protein